MRKTILWKYLFTARERRLYPRRYKLSNAECKALKSRITRRLLSEDYECRMPKLPKPRVRYRLALCCERIRLRDHTMPSGYRFHNNYYYQ